MINQSSVTQTTAAESRSIGQQVTPESMRRRGNRATSSKGSQAEPAGPPRRWKVEELFAGQQRVVIEHQGHEYVLLITRRGGLVLNLMT